MPESLWSQYQQTRSIALRNQIAEENDRLVRKIANRWIGQCPEPIADIIQIGRIGLLKAIERYDPAKGNAFSSFAVPYINGEIQHWNRDHFGSVKIPRRAFEEASKVRNLQRKMAKLGRSIELFEAAAALGIPKERWEWIAEAVQRKQLASLDEVSELADENDRSPQQLAKLHEAIALLPSVHRRCVLAKFFQQLSDEAIAKREGIAIDRVQVLLCESLDRLKTEIGTHDAEDC